MSSDEERDNEYYAMLMNEEALRLAKERKEKKEKEKEEKKKKWF